MEKRILARIIAFLDTALAVLRCIGLVLSIVQKVKVSNVMTGALWAVLAVSFILVFMEAFAAFSLIRATPVEFDGLRRLRWIRFWRGIMVFLVIMQIVGLAFVALSEIINESVVIVLVVLLIYRLLSIYIVQRYMDEIESTVF